jgi:AraC-like DNA-binding protein
MDALSEILRAIKLKGIVYDKKDFCAPWGLEMPKDGFSQFWRVLKGRCVLKIPGGPLIHLDEGDLVFIPHGSSHWIADHPDSARISSIAYVQAIQNGMHLFDGNGEKTVFVGGHFEYESEPLHPFVKDLPRYIHISNLKTKEQYWLNQAAELLFEEIGNERPGSKILIDRMAEILFIHTMRAYLAQSTQVGGFLSAFKDERISKVLKNIHNFPEKQWTLELMSTSAGMSRTLFFNTFKTLVGETPLSYLTNWRIGKAKEILAVDKANIRDIAAQVGYHSEAAFNRIFKLKVNQTPASYRKNRAN